MLLIVLLQVIKKKIMIMMLLLRTASRGSLLLSLHFLTLSTQILLMPRCCSRRDSLMTMFLITKGMSRMTLTLRMQSMKRDDDDDDEEEEENEDDA